MIDRLWIMLIMCASWCYGQGTPVWPKERGLILSVFHDAGNPAAAQLRHLPMFPGYETFKGSIPGVRFQNSLIQFLSSDVDYREKTAYFYDYYLRSIVICTGYNVQLDVANMNFEFMHMGVSRGTVQIAVDWMSHTIYWSDSVYRWIMAAPGQISKVKNDYYMIIADDHLDAPDGLSLDPIRGYLFWSDNGKFPKIERADMMGNGRHTIITKNLVSPLSLEVDLTGQRIFWIDSYTESILSAKYDGSDIQLIKRIAKATLLDLAIFRDVVYVADIKNGNVVTLNKTNGNTVATVLNIKPETIYSVTVYAEEEQPMNRSDVCATLNCPQLCFTNANGAQCACADGYFFNSSLQQCIESNNSTHKSIVYANSSHICRVDIRSLAYAGYYPVCVYSIVSNRTTGGSMMNQVGGTSIKMFDLAMENRVAYFVTADNVIQSRMLDLNIDSNVVETLTVAKGNVSGLAFDAEDGADLYWCESDTSIVYVINVLNKFVKRVKQLVATNPRNLIILQAERKLAWISGSAGSYAIQTMNLDGTSVTAIVSSATEIVSLVFDREKKLFYYMSPSQQTAFSVSSESPGSPIPLKLKIDTTAQLLVLYKNFLAWMYIPADHTYTYLIRTFDFGLNITNSHGYFDDSSIPVDIKVLDVKLQQIDNISPCSFENGGCEHICITKYVSGEMQLICECKLGYTLAVDKRTCTTQTVEDYFIFVSDWTNNALQQIDLLTNITHAFPNVDSGTYMGIFYDSDRKRLMWSQMSDPRIYSAFVNGTDKKIFADLGKFGYPYRMSKDNSTKNIYFTAYGPSSVGFITPAGKIFKVYSDPYATEIVGVVVHPTRGWVYFTVYRPPSYVMRCSMDGQQCIILINGSNVGYADGLTIDYKNDYLFWSDSVYDTVQRCDLEGKNCITIVNISASDSQQIRDLSTDGDFLFYSTYETDHVVRVTLTPPYATMIVGQNSGFGKLDTMTYYNSSNTNIQPVNNSCQDHGGLGDCSTVCVPTPGGRTCMCEDGTQLGPDGRTCLNVFQCSDLITQKNNTDVKITFESNCTRYIGQTCSYNCPPGFTAVGSGKLKCLNVGWDNQTLTLCQAKFCPAVIPNGQLDANCTRMIGGICNFSCNTGFLKVEDKTFCTEDGTYHRSTTDLCIPFKCDATIAHGHLDTQCTRGIGSSCTFTCDKYFNSPLSEITCQGSGWNVNTTTLCREKQCGDDSLTNGYLSSGCGRSVGAVCGYTCDAGYANSTTLVVCRDNGIWHPPDACLDIAVTGPQAHKGAVEDGQSHAGFVAGIVVLALVLVALLIVILLIVRRGISKHRSALKASFHQGVAIENPGFMEAVPQLQPGPSGQGTIGGAPASGAADGSETAGFENPIYGSNNLRSDGQIHVTLHEPYDMRSEEQIHVTLHEPGSLPSEEQVTLDDVLLSTDTREKEQKNKEYIRFQ